MADIVFIVDESKNIGTTNFQLVRIFLHTIVNSLDIGQARVRVGIVTYSNKSTAQVYLDTFNDKDDILQSIKTLPYSGVGTNTGAALNFTREKIFTEQRGRRKGVQQVAVVITEGQSQDDVSKAAIILRRAGVTVYAVGVENANETELAEMASYPPHKHVFTVESFTKLRPLTQSLQKALCNYIIHQPIAVSTSKTDIEGGLSQCFFFPYDH